MSEEEIINDVIIKLHKTNDETLRNLLYLYNKEKEKNRIMKAEFERLENIEDNTEQLKGLLEDEREHNQKLQKELDLSNDCNIAMDYAIKHSINKDIIKEKIKELEKEIEEKQEYGLDCTLIYEHEVDTKGIIKCLKELLEE